MAKTLRTKVLPISQPVDPTEPLRVLVTGGAGFVGSHLCEALVARNHEVICYDSLITGSHANLADLLTSPKFSFKNVDVSHDFNLDGELDWVMHLASPASPADFATLPIEILRAGGPGTLNCLEVARDHGARFFLASTSEVYGDPEVSPQPESYWGRVNPIGPRSVYDEAKRYAEALTFAYMRTHGMTVRVARIFNTYGPRMRRGDGRAVPTFIGQSLDGSSMTVHGDGSQTRSLCYVDDLILGFLALLESEVRGPVNLGNPEEVTVLELAERIREIAEGTSEIVYRERPEDDPQQRKPDLTKAHEELGWEPKTKLVDGLRRTIDWCRQNW